MSVQAMAWVFANSRSKLGARLVLLSIANHAKADGTGAWPSVAVLADESGLSERETRYALRKLEGIGELSTEMGGGPKGTSLYAINMTGANIAGGNVQQKGGNPLHFEGQSTAPEPSLTVKEPSKPLLEDIRFERFYSLYPRKMKRPQAKTAFLRRCKSEKSFDAILDGLERWKLYWEGKDSQFIPYPASWLNGEMWKDEPGAQRNGDAAAGFNAAQEELDKWRRERGTL